MQKLIISLPDGTDQSHELTEESITLGRVSDNAIQIDDASVSSHHAELKRAGEEYELTDLDSTNGTRVNGEPLSGTVALKKGDKIRFGKIEAFYGDDIAAETRPLPEHETVSVTPAETSLRPPDFANASPFKTKHKKKDPSKVGIMAFALFAIAVFAGAVSMVLMLQPPPPQ